MGVSSEQNTHEKVFVVCENMCLEEGLTKEQIRNTFLPTSNIAVIRGRGVTEDITAVSPSNGKEFIKVHDFPTGFNSSNSVVVSYGVCIRKVGERDADEAGEYRFGRYDPSGAGYSTNDMYEQFAVWFTDGIWEGKEGDVISVKYKVPKNLDQGQQFTVDYIIVLLKFED